MRDPNNYYTGSLPATYTIFHGATIPNPGAITQQGYVFHHWYNNALGDSTSVVSSTMPMGNVVIRPKVTPATNTPYTEIHQLYNVDGTVQTVQTNQKTGTTMAMSTSQFDSELARHYRGERITQAEIKPDGSTVVYLRYENHNTYAVENWQDMVNAVKNVTGGGTIFLRQNIDATSTVTLSVKGITLTGKGKKITKKVD